jgi:hypothetical protein
MDRLNPSITRLLPDFQTQRAAAPRPAQPRKPVSPTPWLLAVIALTLAGTSFYFITNDRADRAAAEEYASRLAMCDIARDYGDQVPSIIEYARKQGCNL